MTDNRWQYMDGQMRESQPALLAAFAEESAAAVQAHAPMLDIAYGPKPRMVFDGFRAERPWRGTIAWFHAGYWQSRDKSGFRFIAPALLAQGYDVALVNYPLCPDVTLAELLAATRAAVPAILAWAAEAGRGGLSLIAAGHSAGGQIVSELALAEWDGPSPIAAVAAFSGIYDLAPLLETPLNDKLRLTPEQVRDVSPIHRLRPGLPPALFAVGGGETPAFLAQNAAMARAWAAAGNQAVAYEEPGADHFSLLRALPAMLARLPTPP